MQHFDFIDDELCFIIIVIGLINAYRFASASGGPQVFTQAVFVMRNNCVGSIQNIAVRAVVFFQFNDVFNMKVGFKIAHVADAGAAEAVDGLVVIAYRKHAVVFTGQQFQPQVLQAVGILKFVYQNIAEAVLVMLADVGVTLQQLIAAQQQLGKVSYAIALALFVIFFKNLTQLLGVRVVGIYSVRA